MSEFFFDYKCIAMGEQNKNKQDDKVLDFYLFQDYDEEGSTMCAQIYIPKVMQEKYVEHFTALMEDYRGRINQNYKNFPILIMEFSPCFSKAAGPAFIDFGGVRANMGVIPSVLENSFFIPISDLWKDDLYADNLHPYGKYEVATRIVDTVMPMFYGSYAEGATLDNVSGPTYYGKEKISELAKI